MRDDSLDTSATVGEKSLLRSKPLTERYGLVSPTIQTRLAFGNQLPSHRMQIEDFVKAYQAKSDEELIQLAAAPEHLTSEARVALQGELSRRRISVAEDSGESQNNGVKQVSGRPLREDCGRLNGKVWAIVTGSTDISQPLPVVLQITAPAVILSTIAIITARKEVREILASGAGAHPLAHRFWNGFINYSAWFVGWMAFSFVFRCHLHGVGAWPDLSSAGFFRTHSGTVESLPPFIFASLGSRSDNGRRFDSVGYRRLLDIAPIASAPLWLCDLGSFICTRGSSSSRRVTILSGSASSNSG
jgi:hypothetical protein